MRLLRIPEDTKDTMLVHPVDQPFECVGALSGTIGDLLRASNDVVQLLDAEDSALKKLRRQTLLANFELELLAFDLGRFAVHDATIDRADGDLDLAHVVGGNILQNLIWRLQELLAHRPGKMLRIFSKPILVENLGGHGDHRDHIAHGRQRQVASRRITCERVQKGLEAAIISKAIHVVDKLA